MSETSRTHRLSGLEPDNLLAFLALLGLLRTLELSNSDIKPRIYWDFSGHPLRPIITTSDPMTKEEICGLVLKGLGIFEASLRPVSWQIKADSEKESVKVQKRTGLPIKPACLHSWAARCTRTAQALVQGTQEHQIWRLRCDLLACFASISKDGEVEETPIKLPSGKMAFIGAIFNLAKECQPDDVSRCLFEKWEYKSKGNSLRLSPDEAQRYAYRAFDPSPEGAYTEKGAGALGGLGMLSFPMFEGAKSWSMVAYSGSRREGNISWPIWGVDASRKSDARGASLHTIEAMLRSLPLSRRSPIQQFGPNAIIATARRYVLDPNQGNYGNIARAILISVK